MDAGRLLRGSSRSRYVTHEEGSGWVFHIHASERFTMPITIVLSDEEEHELPSTKEVCPDCEGEGFVLNESMRHHAYTSEEFEEEFDEEGRAQYFRRGGIYDVQCPTCQGKNVVDVVDEEACQGRAELRALLARWRQQERERAQDRAEERRERLMGY